MSDVCSSKDTLHVLRDNDAAIDQFDIPCHISIETLNSAILLNNSIQQQKSIFVQVDI
jgi:hypothetical protein